MNKLSKQWYTKREVTKMLKDLEDGVQEKVDSENLKYRKEIVEEDLDSTKKVKEPYPELEAAESSNPNLSIIKRVDMEQRKTIKHTIIFYEKGKMLKRFLKRPTNRVSVGNIIAIPVRLCSKDSIGSIEKEIGHFILPTNGMSYKESDYYRLSDSKKVKLIGEEDKRIILPHIRSDGDFNFYIAAKPLDEAQL